MIELLAVVTTVILAAMLIQHLRYLRIRRRFAEDSQRILHPAEAFHVIVFFKVRSGQKVVESARNFTHQVLDGGPARLIYAGEAGFTLHSAQLGVHSWDGVVMFEFPTRLDYAEGYTARYAAARDVFADSYFHGLRRDRTVNAFIPQYFLRLRFYDILRGKWRVDPLVKAPELVSMPEFDDIRSKVSRLHALHEINRQGLVVYSLVKRNRSAAPAVAGDPDARLRARMAAHSHGPLHIGRAVSMEFNAGFDSIYIVHYPSARYYGDLLSSQFYHTLVDNHRLSDAMIVPTVPITYRL